MKKKILIGSIIAVTFIVLSSFSLVIAKDTPVNKGKGITLYVGGTGPNNYTTIQSAVNDAIDGDTVFVYDDSSPYYEGIIINRRINLIGEDKNTTIIHGNNTEDVIRVTSNYVTIENFYITHHRHGITFYNADNGIILNNIFSGNFLRAILIIESYNNLIIDNHIDGTESTFYYGIVIEDSGNNNITGNTIVNIYSRGITIDNSDSNIIFKNVINVSIANYAIVIVDGDYNSLLSNIINVYGTDGDEDDSAIYVIGKLNIIKNNILTSFSDGGVTGLRVLGSENVIKNNSIDSFSSVGIELISYTLGNQNIISYNNIINNRNGIIVSGGLNQITFNNFVDNRHNAFFYLAYKNLWTNNFWDNARNYPYLIIGRLDLLFILWVNVDWNPAQEPYDIWVGI